MNRRPACPACSSRDIDRPRPSAIAVYGTAECRSCGARWAEPRPPTGKTSMPPAIEGALVDKATRPRARRR